MVNFCSAIFINLNRFSEPEPQPGQFFAKRVRHNNVIGPWKRCIILNSDEKRCTIRYDDNGKQKDIPKFDIARNKIPSHNDIKTIGTRVIARHRNSYLPYTFKQNQRINLLAGRNDEFFPGIIARAYGADNKYCVFFDDGVVQLVERQHIRCVEENTFEHGMCLSFACECACHLHMPKRNQIFVLQLIGMHDPISNSMYRKYNMRSSPSTSLSLWLS